MKAGAEAGWLEVEDHGPGLTKDQAEQVFSRFYRVDPARTRDHGGAGLGLSIVAAITRAHGGHASVTTQPGRGATFSVTFPLLRRGALAPSGAGVDPVG